MTKAADAAKEYVDILEANGDILQNERVLLVTAFLAGVYWQAYTASLLVPGEVLPGEVNGKDVAFAYLKELKF